MKTKHLKKTGILCLVVTAFLALAFAPFLYGPGLQESKPMGAFLNGVFPTSTPTGETTGDVSYGVVNAFPDLTFIDPVDMLELPGGNEFLIMGLQGHIWKITNDPNTGTKQQLLDISDNVVNDADGGMLGMVLHPDYGKSGSPNAEYIYVFYRYTPVQGTDRIGPTVNGYMRLSRFNLPVGANAINPSSEKVLINVFDRHDWHNGGDMFFGPEDGFLYLAVGDEGAAYDSYGVTQQIDKWLFGGVLRIDVDKRGGAISHPIRKQPQNAGTPPNGWPDTFTQDYYIPNDNPWVDSSGRNLEEFYAIGTRSPHRMTFDPPTGDIWIGDIGQGSKEEVSVVRKGDNLQWPYREGDQNAQRAKPNPIIGNDRPPIHAYGRSVGRAVIGGAVYRGDRYPELKGKYIFGDHETQDVWSLTKTGDNTGNVAFLLNVPVEGVGSKDGISSFFTDSDGIIYILDLFGTARDGGVVRKLVRSGATVDPPKKLSDLNAFANLERLVPVDGLVPYDVNAPLWSDGAEKQRWIALPNDGTHDSPSEQISFESEENWSFPPGTVMVKQFDLPVDESDPSKTVKLETRFLVFTEENDAYAVTYKWNDEQTDAFLIGLDEEIAQVYPVKKSDGSIVDQTWNFPTRSQCMQCHTSVAGYSLGVKTRQLNKNFTYPTTGITGNQLETWAHLDMFSEEIGTHTKLPASANINSAWASDEMKVRSYIDANCAYCHRPNGVEGAFDGRALTALYDQSMINTDVVSHASLPGYQIVKPQDTGNSMLFLRDNSTADDRMPPIGRNLVDEDYLQVLIGWIDGLDGNGPETVPEGRYTLRAKHSNKFLAVENGSRSADARAVQISSKQEEYASWRIENMGDKKYRITAMHSDMVLSLRDTRTDRGGEVVQEPWNGAQRQLWYFEDTDQGFYRISNAYNGLELNIFGIRQSENAHAILWSPGNYVNQQWKLEPAGAEDDFAVIGETGKARANHNWFTVTLKNSYKNPVVIAGGASYGGSNQSTVRVQNVTGRSFQVRIDEWECWDGAHVYETIPYLVVEAGVHELPNGKIMQAGTIEGVNHHWHTHQFDRPFNEKPLVFGQCVTENEAEALNVRFDGRNVTSGQIRLKLKEQDHARGGHAPENVSWVAVEAGSFSDSGSAFEFSNTGRNVGHNWYDIDFVKNYGADPVFIGEIGSQFGSDAAALRYKDLGGGSVKVFVEEEKCGDSELYHTTEEIHYMVSGVAGDVMGKTLQESQGAVALKANGSKGEFNFMDFSAENTSHMVDMVWSTSNDQDIATYRVERSVDGYNFVPVTDQPGLRSNQRNTYKGYDYNPVIGKSVYRIAAIKADGETLYSYDLKLDFAAPGANVLVYPNPVAQGQVLTADITRIEDAIEDLTISIHGTDGKLIRSRSKRMSARQAFEQFEVGDLESGVYILKVQGRDWGQSRKFVVE